MSAHTTQDMSEAIADAILNASGKTATRIALRQERALISTSDTPGEHDLGGLNRAALIRTITEAIHSEASRLEGKA
jgi:hypothetical protein